MPQTVIEIGVVLALVGMIFAVQRQCAARCDKMEDCVEGELKEMRGAFNEFSKEVGPKIATIEADVKWLKKQNGGKE